ncbi:hypothetical protein Tco_0678706 [Tanacetum coccineum]|uniref:Uncharacterized protein n=1 Tax=Tanacetum coccineum TaxID=301880 RepID=A0ABQ4XFT9_9ASTR
MNCQLLCVSANVINRSIGIDIPIRVISLMCGLPTMTYTMSDVMLFRPVALPSPNYVPGPEHPSSPDYVPGLEHPPSPVEVLYVPEPEYPEYLAPSDAEASLEDQPLPVDASPTALLPGYVVYSDPEEDPEEDHVDYPADGGDDDDEPSDDDEDDDDTDDKDKEPFKDEDDGEEEEEEHLAPVDSSVVPVVDPTRLRRAWKTVRHEPSMSPSMKARITEYAAAPTPPSPPPSPLSPWTSPLLQIPSPPLHVSSPPLPLPPPTVDSPTYAEHTIHYHHHRPKGGPFQAELPPRKIIVPTAPTSRYEVGESSTATPRPTRGHRADYGFIGTTDAEDRQTQLFQRVDELVEDRQFHYETARLLDQEALDSYPDAGLPYRLTGVTDDDIDYTSFITTGIVVSGIGTNSGNHARDQTHADDLEGTGSSA